MLIYLMQYYSVNFFLLFILGFLQVMKEFIKTSTEEYISQDPQILGSDFQCSIRIICRDSRKCASILL